MAYYFCYLTITDVHVTLYLQIIDFQFPSCCTSQPTKKLNQIITVNSSTNTPRSYRQKNNSCTLCVPMFHQNWPRKFPRNRLFFPRICPWKSRKIWLFSASYQEPCIKVYFWMDLGGFGWFRVVLAGFGWFWVVPCFSNYAYSTCSWNLSNRPQVSMVYRLINHRGCW